jgi:hypothetical protein
MTDLAERLPATIEARVDTALMRENATFNEWEQAIEICAEHESVSQWYLGDLWNEGRARFATIQHHGVERVRHKHDTIVDYGRIAKIFPPRRTGEAHSRVDLVSFRHHVIVATVVDPDERITWLEDARDERWGTRRLADEVAKAYERKGLPRPSFALRDSFLRDKLIEAAGLRQIDANTWLAEAVREKLEREGLSLEAAA